MMEKENNLSIRREINHPNYGDPISGDDESYMVDNVMNYHPHKVAKMEAGLKHIILELLAGNEIVRLPQMKLELHARAWLVLRFQKKLKLRLRTNLELKAGKQVVELNLEHQARTQNLLQLQTNLKLKAGTMKLELQVGTRC
ncbi:unnamed protein product [Fraxinus pennsylvanica]|uniref:Uncharacterized protein n=1 Tax=Fraxinus pennsylvanica TaxID=56036 RepID=A0AAD2ACA2_9LAMI|nr:unnamed protein product [Fraxinus pennsylvanica]